MMHAPDVFTTVAQQQGYASEVAAKAYTAARVALRSAGIGGHIFYIYRTGGQGVGSAGPTARPRQVLVFQTADSALAFAQQQQLGLAPRLLRLDLAHLLGVLIQRPTIQALLFVHEPLETTTVGLLPASLHLERSKLVDTLKGDTPDGQSL